MAYDANPAATHNPTTGVVVPTNWLDLINSNFAEIGSAWTAYTPTWTSSGTAPSIGNGTLSGAYKMLGKTLFVRIYMSPGSTTTFGTGTYSFALPSGTSLVSEEALAARLWDTSAGLIYAAAAGGGGGSTSLNIAYANAFVGATYPFTWATGDILSFTGVIEIA